MHQLIATWLIVLRRRAAISPMTCSSGCRPGSTCLRRRCSRGARSRRQGGGDRNTTAGSCHASHPWHSLAHPPGPAEVSANTSTPVCSSYRSMRTAAGAAAPAAPEAAAAAAGNHGPLIATHLNRKPRGPPGRLEGSSMLYLPVSMPGGGGEAAGSKRGQRVCMWLNGGREQMGGLRCECARAEQQIKSDKPSAVQKRACRGDVLRMHTSVGRMRSDTTACAEHAHDDKHVSVAHYDLVKSVQPSAQLYSVSPPPPLPPTAAAAAVADAPRARGE